MTNVSLVAVSFLFVIFCEVVLCNFDLFVCFMSSHDGNIESPYKQQLMEKRKADRERLEAIMVWIDAVAEGELKSIDEVFGEAERDLRVEQKELEEKLKRVGEKLVETEKVHREMAGRSRSVQVDLKSRAEGEIKTCDLALLEGERALSTAPLCGLVSALSASASASSGSSSSLELGLHEVSDGFSRAVSKELQASLALMFGGRDDEAKQQQSQQPQPQQQQPEELTSCLPASLRARLKTCFHASRRMIFEMRPIRTIGGSSSGVGALESPRGMCIVGSSLYVADWGNHRISVYDVGSGSFLRSIGSGQGSGDGQLYGPYGSSASGDFLYVADCGNDRVSVCGVDGRFVRTFGTKGSGAGQLNCPCGLFVLNDEVCVAESYNHRISVFRANGEFLRWIGRKGSGDGELTNPAGVCIVNNLLFAADNGNHRVSVFGVDGSFKRSFHRKGANSGQLTDPRSIFHSCGVLFVVEGSGGGLCVSVFGLDGSFVCDIGRGHLQDPECALFIDGRLFVSDDGSEKKCIVVFE